MLTPEEKKRMLDSFRKPVQEDQPDPWTEERLLEVAKRIIERLGLNEELQ